MAALPMPGRGDESSPPPIIARVLGATDLVALEAFLVRFADSTMFLRGNLRRAGIDDRGREFEGTYAGAFEEGELVGVASHYWNGSVIVEAPVGLGEVVRAAVTASGREVRGILGRDRQVKQARRELGLEAAPAALQESEGLFSLDLAELRAPALLEQPGTLVRAPRHEELALLTDWRIGYTLEALGASDAESVRARCRSEMELYQREDRHWLLEVDGRPVAYSAFNAVLPGCVQVGGVWTPPELRGRGYGRAVVAGTLIAARQRGVRRSVLFTDNPAAERAYRALGYQRVGDFGMVLFADGHWPAG